MKPKYCVLGESLKHTMSPIIHKRLFDLRNRAFSYDVLELSTDELLNDREKTDSFSGLNVTIPHKVSVIELLDELDESAKDYGAVNCIKNENGYKVGYNTDAYGFTKSLEAKGFSLSGKVLLIGLGGVGRTVAYEACRSGGDVTALVLERNLSTANSVASEIKEKLKNAKIKTVTEVDAGENFDILINATPCGMYPKVDAAPISKEILSNCKCVFDLIYNPSETLLMKEAKELRIPALGGMAMLVWQAVKAHEIWDNDFYTLDEVNEIISEMEKRVNEDFKL